MPKKSNNFSNILIIAGFYLIVLFLWWTLRGSLSTFYRFTIAYAILVAFSYIIYKVFTKKVEAQDEKITKKVSLLSKSECQKLMNQQLNDEMYKPKNMTPLLQHIVQPIDSEKTPSSFYKRLFEEKFDDNYYLQFINRKDAELNIAVARTPFSFKQQQNIIEQASESTREYIPKLIQHPDGRTETEYSPIRVIKQAVSPKEEIIGEN